MKTSVDEAIAVIRGYCDKITSCRECRYRSWTLSCSFKEKFPCDWDKITSCRECRYRSWTLSCSFKEKFPCDWAMDVGSEVEEGEQEE